MPVWLADGDGSGVAVGGLDGACAGFSVGRAVGIMEAVELSWGKLPLFVMESADTVPAKTRIAVITIVKTIFSCVWRLVLMLFNCLASPFTACRLLSGDFIAVPIF